MQLGMAAILGKAAIGRNTAEMRKAFTLVELLAAVAIAAVLAGLLVAAAPSIRARAESADALAKIRLMGSAVLTYATDHSGSLPPLFPGQVLEYESGRGGRIVTECAAYLGIEPGGGKRLVTRLMPGAYARLDEPADKNALRVYVMNSAVTNNGTIVNPFGRVTTPGQPPTGTMPVASLSGAGASWMMSTADRQQANVAGAPWKNNTPENSPLGDQRAVFHFDGSAGLEKNPAP